MSDLFEMSVEDGYVLLAGSRAITPEAVQRFFETAPERVRATGLDRVLIDMRGCSVALSTTDRYFYAVEFAERFRGLRMAVVQSPPLLDPRRFGTIVATNRGLDTATFATPAEARAWLLEDRAAGDPGAPGA